MAITLNGTSGITSSGTITSDGLTIDTNTLYVDDTNNRVGVGTITPATALDVTGTLTSDGLTVDGSGTAIDLRSNNNAGTALNTLRFTDTDPTAVNNAEIGKIEFYATDTAAVVASIAGRNADASPDGYLQFNTAEGTTLRSRMVIDNTGDISFYEDTGTSQKFFWDASEERLGIGTTSPTQALEVAGNILINTSGNPYLAVKTSGAGNNPFIRIQADTNYWDLQSLFSNADDELDFRYNGSSKMIIDNSGNVGIGTPSPSYKLDVNGKVYGDSFTSDPIASWQITGSYAGTTQYVFTTKNDINALGYGNGMYRFVAFLDTYNAGASHYSVYMPYRPFYFYNVNSNATSLVEMGNSYGRPFMGHAPNTFTTPSLYVRHRSSTDSTYPGNHTFEWDMKTAFSNLSTSGGYQFIIYLYKIS